MEYICEQIAEAGNISYKKMFGEYAVYCDEKVVAFVCDNQLFVKPTEVLPKGWTVKVVKESGLCSN
jgi:TfoX/Sxy family transcriptional regulator of competence genes